jgi:tetratricopeptide (TPR) repeat protein
LVLAILGGGALLGCVLVTALQISYWQSSEDLFLHALGVTQNNYVADNALGKVFERRGDNRRALVLYREAVRIEPRFPVSQYNLGLCLIAVGLKDQAFAPLAAAAKLDPGNADAQFNLGVFFMQNQRWPDAGQCFQAALKLRPAFVPAHTHLAQALAQQNKFAEAAAQYREALRLDPHFADATNGLATLLATHTELR